VCITRTSSFCDDRTIHFQGILDEPGQEWKDIALGADHRFPMLRSQLQWSDIIFEQLVVLSLCHAERARSQLQWSDIIFEQLVVLSLCHAERATC